MPNCPFCGSITIGKDGTYSVKDGKRQRYRCRRCGKRFSLSTIRLLETIAELPIRPWKPVTEEKHPEAPKKPEAEARLEAQHHAL